MEEGKISKYNNDQAVLEDKKSFIGDDYFRYL
jgi:hypothetical protein